VPVFLSTGNLAQEIEWLGVSEYAIKILKRIGAPRICSWNSKIFSFVLEFDSKIWDGLPCLCHRLKVDRWRVSARMKRGQTSRSVLSTLQAVSVQHVATIEIALTVVCCEGVPQVGDLFLPHVSLAYLFLCALTRLLVTSGPPFSCRQDSRWLDRCRAAVVRNTSFRSLLGSWASQCDSFGPHPIHSKLSRHRSKLGELTKFWHPQPPFSYPNMNSKTGFRIWYPQPLQSQNLTWGGPRT